MGGAAARWVESPPAGWSELLATDPAATPAHLPALWSALAEVLPGMSVRFLAVEADGALVGGAPLLVERRAGLHWLHALPFLLSGAPLARDGHHAGVDAAAGRALADLQRELRAVGGEWALYRPCGPEPDAAAVAAPEGETRTLEAALVDLGAGLDAARARVDRKTRQELRAAARLLAFAEEPDALEEAYALHVAQSRHWPGHRPLPLELPRRLLARGTGGAPPARLFTVRDAGGLLAATLALDGARETFPWWSGLHPDGRPLHAFAFLLWSVVEWAAEHGRARVNLGASGGQGPVALFKDSLGARALRYPVRWLDARRAPPAGKLVAALQRRLRRRRALGEAAA